MILIEKCLEMGATKDGIITPGSGVTAHHGLVANPPGRRSRHLHPDARNIFDLAQRAPVFLWPRFCQIAPNKKKPGISRAFGHGEICARRTFSTETSPMGRQTAWRSV
jgi:hypothetical protein